MPYFVLQGKEAKIINMEFSLATEIIQTSSGDVAMTVMAVGSYGASTVCSVLI